MFSAWWCMSRKNCQNANKTHILYWSLGLGFISRCNKVLTTMLSFRLCGHVNCAARLVSRGNQCRVFKEIWSLKQTREKYQGGKPKKVKDTKRGKKGKHTSWRVTTCSWSSCSHRTRDGRAARLPGLKRNLKPACNVSNLWGGGKFGFFWTVNTKAENYFVVGNDDLSELYICDNICGQNTTYDHKLLARSFFPVSGFTKHFKLCMNNCTQ